MFVHIETNDIWKVGLKNAQSQNKKWGLTGGFQSKSTGTMLLGQ